jgi:hypothetical protein
LRTVATEHEKICQTASPALDSISLNLIQTPLNSFQPGLARFANGIDFHAKYFTTGRICKTKNFRIQCKQDFMAMDTYPALYIIFSLLNAFRRGMERKNIWREFRRQKIALTPRLSFWIPLCRAAGLLDENESQIRVTRYARQWLNKTPDEQTFRLIDAWQNAPKNYRARQFRRKLLWKLKYDQPLTQKDLGALNGLEALGLFAGGNLTRWGKFFIKGEGELPTPKPSAPCAIHENHFVAPVAQHTDLLWELEKYLRPVSPGRYPLTKRALHFHTGDPHELIALLERGLQKEISKSTRALILHQPSLRVLEGFVIEFSNATELKELRRQPNLRQHVEQYLSPRHVFVSSADAKRLLKLLEQRGIHAAFHEELPETPKKRTHFPGKVLLQPTGKGLPKMEILGKYMQLQQALDILYRAPGFPAEQRRITPLSLEQRGEHTYVIAYCQTRRAQRTFRLDRIEIPGTW